MVRAIGRKAFADLRSRPLQTIALAFVITLAAATLTLSLAVQKLAHRPYEQLMQEAGPVHAWFYSSNHEAIAAIAERPGVNNVSGPFPRLQGKLVENDGTTDVSFWGMDATPPAIGHPVLTSGRWIETPDEVVLEAGLTRALGLSPGDTITVETKAGTSQLRVVGVALTPARLPYPQWAPGHMFVLPETAVRLAGDTPDWELGVQLARPESSSAFIRAAIMESRSMQAGGFGAIDWTSLRDDATSQVEVQVIFFRIFGTFALAAVALIIVNVVSSGVLAGYREIGVLKAIGFTPLQVAAVFLGSQVLTGLMGAVAGVAIGFLIAPLFLTDVAGVLNAPRAPGFDPEVAALVVAGVTLAVGLCAVIPALQGGRVPALKAMGTRTPQPRGASRVARAGQALHLPPPVVVGLKDLFTRPVRTWFTVAALVVAVATVVMTLGIEATFARGKDDPEMFANETYHLLVSVSPDADANAAEQAIGALEGVSAVVAETRLVGRTDGPFGMFNIRAMRGDVNAVFPRVTSGRLPRTANEVLVAKPLAKLLDLAPGDRVTVDMLVFGGNGPGSERLVGTTNLIVTGLYAETDDAGRLMITLEETVSALEADVPPALIGLRIADTDENEAIAAALQAALGPSYAVEDEVAQNRADLQQVARDARPILLGLDVMLVAIAIVNVLTTLLFSVRERYREAGMLKAIGFTPRDILVAVITGGCVLALIAVVVGIPAGLWITETLFDFFGRDEGWQPGVAVTPAAWQLALLLPFGIAVAVIGAWIPAHRAAAMPATEALRFE